jgi:general stress protein 26
MGDNENLNASDAAQKIKELADGSVVMLCTYDESGRLRTRPMVTQGVDPDGTLWFFSPRGSHKNADVAREPRVELIYSDGDRSRFLFLSGTAAITRDQQKIDELWTGFAKTWFNDGPEDPDLTLLSVKPEQGHYWEPTHNRMAQLTLIAVGAVTGKTFDVGRDGKLAP